MPPFLSPSFGRRSSDVVGLDIQPGFVAAVLGRCNGAVVAERAAAVSLPADTMREGDVVEAAQRDMVERLLAAVRGAGLTPVGVDMSAFALIRSLYRSGAAGGAERVLYLNVDGLTNVAIAEGTECRFTRVLGGGIEEIAAELAERRGIPHDHARALLADVDLSPPPADAPQAPAKVASDPDAEADPAGVETAVLAEPAEELMSPDASLTAPQPAGPQAFVERHAGEPAHAPEASREELVPSDEPSAEEEARAVLENGVRAIAGEVRNSLDFHRSQEGGGDALRVVLSGSALELRGFAEALQSSLGVDVHGATVALAEESLLEGVSARRLAVATGLSAHEVAQ